jgi:hypothetical protein
MCHLYPGGSAFRPSRCRLLQRKPIHLLHCLLHSEAIKLGPPSESRSSGSGILQPRCNSASRANSKFGRTAAPGGRGSRRRPNEAGPAASVAGPPILPI